MKIEIIGHPFSPAKDGDAMQLRRVRYSYFFSGVDSLFVIPEGNLRFARITKTTSGGEPL